MRFELMIFFGNISSRVFLFQSLSVSVSIFYFHFMSLYLFIRPSKVEYYFFWTLFSFCTCRSFVKTFISTNLDTCLCSFAFWNRSLLESRLFHSNTITGYILFYSRYFFSRVCIWEWKRGTKNQDYRHSQQIKKNARKEYQLKTMKM